MKDVLFYIKIFTNSLMMFEQLNYGNKSLMIYKNYQLKVFIHQRNIMEVKMVSFFIYKIYFF